MLVKKILMMGTALFLFCGCAAKPAKTSAANVEQTKAEEKQNSSVSENADQKHTEQVSKGKKQTSNAPSEKESAKPETKKEVSKTEKKSKSKKNTVSSEKKLSSSPVISEDASDSHIHDWIHHEAIGYYDTKVVTDQAAWDEKISDGGYKCNGCGQIFATGDALDGHFDAHDGLGDACDGATSSTVESKYVHHDAVTHTEQIWIQDSTAYDECSICGAKK